MTRQFGWLKSAVRKARLGREEELEALKRLDDQARKLERYVSGPSFETIVAEEKQRSPDYGGRSVFGWEHSASDFHNKSINNR